MRNGQLIRVLSVLRTLDAGGRYTLRRLATAHGVHERTIRRDLEALQAAHVPIGHTHDTGEWGPSHWWLVKRRREGA